MEGSIQTCIFHNNEEPSSEEIRCEGSEDSETLEIIIPETQMTRVLIKSSENNSKKANS